MSFITAGSEPSMLTESQLFYTPPTITERQAVHDLYIGPSAATFDEANDITFEIAPSTDLISLADIRFECELYLFRNDGTALVRADNVCPINNILSSLFQCVVVELAGRSISDPANLYFMRSYIENLLGYNEAAMHSQLSSEGFMFDSTQDFTGYSGNYTAPVAAAAGAPAVAERNTWPNQDQIDRFRLISNSTPLMLSGKIHCDLFQQDKPLVPGVSLSIKFIRSRSGLAFTALTEAGLPKAVIRKPKLFIRKFEPSAMYMNALSKKLLAAPAVYHFERVQMRQSTINTGQQFAEWPNLVAGQLPKMMIITTVSSRALSGTHDTTPYRFNHYDLSYINAEVDGKIYPSNGYSMDFTRHQTLNCYDGLCRVLEIFNDANKGLPFDRQEYEKGFTMYGFDFTPSGTSRGALTIIKQGNLNLNLKFRTALPEPVVVIAYLVFDATIAINNARQALFDFSA